MKIAILGWTSWFGKWLAERFKDLEKRFNTNFDIVITWRNRQKWEKVAKQLGVKFSQSNVDAVKDADITIVSVTIWNTEKVIHEVWPYLKPNSIFADVTSIKKVPYDAMMKYSKKVFVLPTHPMFGPYITSIAGQVIILTPPEYVKKTKFYNWFKNFLKSEWAKVIELSPEEHDQIMSIIQGLTHFSLFVVSRTLQLFVNQYFKKQDQVLKFLENFTSPVYKMLISLVWRYMSQNGRLYAEIQANNQLNQKMQEIFINVAKDFNKLIFKDKDLDSFVAKLEEWKQFFGEYAMEGQKYTDKIIYFLANQVKKIKNNIWKVIEIKNIYTNQHLEWVLEDFIEDENLFILDWKKYDLNEWIIL